MSKLILLAACAMSACSSPSSPSSCANGQLSVQGRCAAPSDPCMGITQSGICSDATDVQFCSLGSDGAVAQLVSFACQPGESCQIVGGVAQCVLTAACRDGAQRCSGASDIQVCSGGAWTTTTCPRQCMTSPIGDFCGLDADTQTLTGSLQYELRAPNAALTDWDAPVPVIATSFLVITARPVGNDYQFIDVQTTDDNGNFSILVPAVAQTGDGIFFYAVGTNPDGSLAYLVADPNLGSGSGNMPGQVGASPQIWAWGFETQPLTSPASLVITEPMFSGAARVFDYLRYVYQSSVVRWPSAPPAQPLVVWLGQGVDWTCGACEIPAPTFAFGQPFRTQIFMPGGSDERYWSDSLIAHELGHWAMGTFGRAVGESGGHCVGLPTAPGLAWSEGYATWFSADTIGDPRYIDKQHGSMFWFDLSNRTSSGSTWLRPTAALGPQQDINENEIAAMLWNLTATQGLGATALNDALASPRMTTPPFPRGYHREVWSLNADCSRSQVEDTGQSTTSFADFLDALVCGGLAAGAVDQAVNPFPYQSQQPLCGN